MQQQEYFAAEFAAQREFLWGMCYRMTGCAADADDLVQETFVRLLEHPPQYHDAHPLPLRPWLVRVAMNASRDALRRRRRQRYVGPWLPSPIETKDLTAAPAPPSYEPILTDGATTDGLYDLLESVSFAFLLALDALTPQQRAVLLLRDVFDYSVRDTAAALDITGPSVKTTHHRARKAMQTYNQHRCVPTAALQAQTREALGQLVTSLVDGDMARIEALLSGSVRALNDSNGEFFAARVPLIGPQRVALFHRNIVHRRLHNAHFTVQMLNGLPSLVLSYSTTHQGEPPQVVMHCTLAADGRIGALYSVVASGKLTHVNFG